MDCGPAPFSSWSACQRRGASRWPCRRCPPSRTRTWAAVAAPGRLQENVGGQKVRHRSEVVVTVLREAANLVSRCNLRLE